MQDWTPMIAAVEKLRGAKASAEEAFRQLEAKVAELTGQGNAMNDAEDQKKVDEFAAAFSEIAAALPKAIAANPAPGTESTGGNA